MQFDTRAIHDGQPPDPSTGAVTVPIYQTSTYVQEAVGQLKDGYDYSRTANPTRRALETCIASLESAGHGFAFASGMAATTTVMHLLGPGDRVVSVNDVYGGTYRLFSKVYEPKGMRFTYLSAEQCNAELAAHMDGERLLWLESPTNPLLNLVDIAASVRIAHDAGAIVVVDNTFSSPYLQRPIELGADIVVHSATKYLGGHSDLVSGIAVTLDEPLAERLSFLQNSPGACGGAVRLVAGAARAEDAGRCGCASTVRTPGHGRVAGRRPSRGARLYPGLPPPPRTRVASAPDARLLRHGLVPGRRERLGARLLVAQHASIVAGGEPGRRRVANRDPGADDARQRRGLPVRRRRTWSGCRSASSHGRPDGRSGEGALG